MNRIETRLRQLEHAAAIDDAPVGGAKIFLPDNRRGDGPRPEETADGVIVIYEPDQKRRETT